MNLQRLRADHESAVLDFELTNRAYFALSVSDRGDDYFRDFSEHYRARLADQERGVDAYYLLLNDDGRVVGRFNLYDLSDGVATVGYRVAERVSGRGVATSGLRELCRLARDEHGVHTLHAATSDANVGSQRVLEKSGFVRTRPAEPADVGGRPGWRYELHLGVSPSDPESRT